MARVVAFTVEPGFHHSYTDRWASTVRPYNGHSHGAGTWGWTGSTVRLLGSAQGLPLDPHDLCSGLNDGPKRYFHLEPMIVSLLRKRVFVDVIKLESQDETIMDHPVGPKSNDKCSYKRHAEERLKEKDCVRTEAEME